VTKNQPKSKNIQTKVLFVVDDYIEYVTLEHAEDFKINIESFFEKDRQYIINLCKIRNIDLVDSDTEETYFYDSIN